MVFCWHSRDHYMKRMAISKGWVENINTQSAMWNVKWEALDSNQDTYKVMRAN